MAPGAAADPLGTLRLQQAPERAAIEEQYKAAIGLANQALALAQQDNNQQAVLLATWKSNGLKLKKSSRWIGSMMNWRRRQPRAGRRASRLLPGDAGASADRGEHLLRRDDLRAR